MPTLIVMRTPLAWFAIVRAGRSGSVPRDGRSSMQRASLGCRKRVAGGKQRVDVAESITRLDERHAVPLEFLLDQQGAAERFAEAAGRLVLRNHPDDETVGAL